LLTALVLVVLNVEAQPASSTMRPEPDIVPDSQVNAWSTDTVAAPLTVPASKCKRVNRQSSVGSSTPLEARTKTPSPVIAAAVAWRKVPAISLISVPAAKVTVPSLSPPAESRTTPLSTCTVPVLRSGTALESNDVVPPPVLRSSPAFSTA
jgi:hypothetical protein